MEEVIKERMIEAAMRQEGDPGWSARVLPAGLQLTYTWYRRQTPTSTKDFFTVESLISWSAIERAKINPLLTAMDDLMKQKTEFGV